MELALFVLLVDCKVGATPLDQQAYEYLSHLGARVAVTVTKIDRLSRGQRGNALRSIGTTLNLGEETPLIPVSAQSGEGIKDLWRVIDLHLEASTK